LKESYLFKIKTMHEVLNIIYILIATVNHGTTVCAIECVCWHMQSLAGELGKWLYRLMYYNSISPKTSVT